jgi:hypothetical protein
MSVVTGIIAMLARETTMEKIVMATWITEMKHQGGQNVVQVTLLTMSTVK